MDKKKLAKELATRIRTYRARAKLIKIDAKSLGDTVFVQEKNETLFNPKYLKVAEYYDIKALDAFMKCHPQMETEVIKSVLSDSKEEFEFLQKLQQSNPTMVEEIKHNGAKPFAISYISNLLYPKQEETLEQ